MMKAILLFTLTIPWFACLIGPAVAQTPERTEGEMTQEELWSYAVGMNVGTKLRYAKSVIDLEALAQGIRDVLEGATLITHERGWVLRKEFNEIRSDLTVRERAEEGKENLAAGKEFLVLNALKDGVVTTESGLQYEVLVEGDGPHPKETDEVEVHCHKMYVNGVQYESSFNFGYPYSFPLRREIAGWREGLLLMKVGSVYRLYIPSDLAYGPVGQGAEVGPYETLIYETELLAIRSGDGE